MLFLAGAALALLLGCNSSSADKRNAPLNPQQAAGRRIFEMQCATCHSAYSSESHGGPPLEGLFQKKELPSGAPANDARVREAILEGRAKMPPFKYMLTERQVDDLLAYLHTL
jgi:mono/diheme cytochrome c family protein